MELRRYDGEVVSIDVEIAPLISELWRRGIATYQSCQEFRPGTVWIAFPDADSAIRFTIELGLNEGDDDLRQRALMPDVASPDSTPPLPWEWHWSAQPYPEDGTFAIGVEFPRSDLDALHERLAIAPRP